MFAWLRERLLGGECRHSWHDTTYSVVRRTRLANGSTQAVSIADFRECRRCGAIESEVY